MATFDNPRPTLILLPGLLCDNTVFAAALPRLRDVANVLVPELHGFDSIASMAERVLAQTPGPFSLAGFSMGGRVAFQLAHLALERIVRFCVLDTSASSVTSAEMESRTKLAELGRSKGMGAVAEAWLPTMVHPNRSTDATFLQPLTEMVRRMTADTLTRQTRALLTRPDAMPVLSRIRCPALIMGGAEDRGVPPARLEAIAAAIPQAKLKIVADCGHFLPFEQPAAFAEGLLDWLRTPA